MNMQFIPFQSVGLFKLDGDVEEYDILYEYNEFGNGEMYVAWDKSHFLTVEDRKIRSVYCYEELIYKNINLIGLTIKEFQKITKARYSEQPEEMDIHKDEPPEYLYKFDEIGLGVWTRYDKIVCISASGHRYYADD